MFQADSEEAKMHQKFSQVKDEHFMALLKRRLWMVVFPGELAPPANEIVIEPLYREDACCGHDDVQVFVGRESTDHADGVMLKHQEIYILFNEFFGVGDA